MIKEAILKQIYYKPLTEYCSTDKKRDAELFVWCVRNMNYKNGELEFKKSYFETEIELLTIMYETSYSDKLACLKYAILKLNRTYFLTQLETTKKIAFGSDYILLFK